MNKLSRGRATHSDKLEHWLGAECVKKLSNDFKDFYYPVLVRGVPGEVYVMPGGDFAGEIAAGSYMSKHDAARVTLRKLRRRIEHKAKKDNALGVLLEMVRAEGKMSSLASIGAFASVDAVIAAYTGGKGQQIIFRKTGLSSNATGNSNDLWICVGQPVAGAAASAAPGGIAPTSATTGALGFKNLGAANSAHYLNWALTSSVTSNSLLLYDRTFAVAKTMNSTGTEAVTGVPTRYTSTVSGNIQYAGGNFCFPSNPTTILAATAHNWTVCQYTNQAGTTAQSMPSIAGVSGCVVGGVDLSIGNWFIPLASGDIGLTALSQMQCNALVATGTIDFVIGHPIAINACPISNIATLDDGLYTSLNLTGIMDSACLSFLELPKPATTAVNYSGLLRTVSE